MHSIRFFDRQATPYAFLQPTEQRRPNPRHSSSRREPRPQRLSQGQRRRKTCRIGRRPPRNIVPTRAELSLLKQCRVQPILCNTAPTAPTLSIHSTSAARNFHIATLSAWIFQAFCEKNSQISQNLRLNKIAVLDFCSSLILSLQMDFAQECLKTYDALIHYIGKIS